MQEANKDESNKCKHIARTALAAGDAGKAVRFLQKAKSMSPGDASLDALIAEAQSAAGAASAGRTSDAGNDAGASAAGGSPASGVRSRAPSAAGGTATAGAQRTGKDGTYTADQMKLVQRILRTKDYYEVLEVPRSADEEAVKRSYKKLALKLHPDKNKAPGADEAFKRVAKVVQCLTDREKRSAYDRYGDEERVPRRQQQHQYAEEMSPAEVFASFFGGGATAHVYYNGKQRGGDGFQLLPVLPVLLMILLTVASNFASFDSGGHFSFTQGPQYRNARSTATLDINYYVSDNFEEKHAQGTRDVAEFDRQVEIHYVRNLYNDCDYQQRVTHQKILIARSLGSSDELMKAKNHPRPACTKIEKIKKRHPQLYRSALQMGIY